MIKYIVKEHIELNERIKEANEEVCRLMEKEIRLLERRKEVIDLYIEPYIEAKFEGDPDKREDAEEKLLSIRKKYGITDLEILSCAEVYRKRDDVPSKAYSQLGKLMEKAIVDGGISSRDVAGKYYEEIARKLA